MKLSIGQILVQLFPQLKGLGFNLERLLDESPLKIDYTQNLSSDVNVIKMGDSGEVLIIGDGLTITVKGVRIEDKNIYTIESNRTEKIESGEVLTLNKHDAKIKMDYMTPEYFNDHGYFNSNFELEVSQSRYNFIDKSIEVGKTIVNRTSEKEEYYTDKSSYLASDVLTMFGYAMSGGRTKSDIDLISRLNLKPEQIRERAKDSYIMVEKIIEDAVYDKTNGKYIIHPSKKITDQYEIEGNISDISQEVHNKVMADKGCPTVLELINGLDIILNENSIKR